MLDTLPFEALTPTELKASLCRESFFEFVRSFWFCVPGVGKRLFLGTMAKRSAGWHLELLCQEFQAIAERVFRNEPKLYDEVVNVPPGTSKTSILSILAPAWVWTRMPEARIITASHTSSLVLDISSKSRDVITSEKYQTYFPEIEIRTDTDAKGHYRNTLGGERQVCTVSGMSPTGQHCFPWETEVETDRGPLPIGRIVEEELPVKVMAFDHNLDKVVWSGIEGYGCMRGESLYRILLSNGKSLEATGNHPVYVVEKGYLPVIDLVPGDEVIHVLERNQHQEELSELRQASIGKADQNGWCLLRCPLQRSSCWQGTMRSRSQSKFGALRNVSQGSLSCSISSRQNKEQVGILFSQMSGRIYERSRSSEIQWNKEKVRRVRQGNVCYGESCGNQSFLQYGLSEQNRQGRKPSPKKTSIRSSLRELRRSSDGVGEAVRQAGTLLPRMCEQEPFQIDEGRRQFQLHRRNSQSGLYRGVQKYSPQDKREGGVSLLSLSKVRETSCYEAGYSPYRLEQSEQRERQFSRHVPEMPYGDARIEEETAEGGRVFVVSVERTTRIPDAVYNLQIAEYGNFFVEGILTHNCHIFITDDPIDPKQAVSVAELENARRFINDIIPSRVVDKEVSVFFLVMQRLGLGDPTEIMLKAANVEGAVPIRHICLPAELVQGDDGEWLATNVQPPELAASYVSGLLDPKRMPRGVLNTFKAKGALYYATQFLQRPYAVKGGLFEADWFNNRIKAAPYAARRIRYWDKSATADGGCGTAGVLMSKDEKGYYVEHCEWGQWDTHKRNAVMRATALRDRARYGPNNEPIIYIEREGGSTGKDAVKWDAMALDGFNVVQHQPTGDKDVRAGPWSAQCAAGNVYIVDNGEHSGTGKADWDIQAFVDEMVAFKPAVGKRGGLKDRVDSCSGCHSVLSNTRSTTNIRVLHQRPKKGEIRFVVCTKEELGSLVIEQQPSLLLVINDPLEMVEEVMCSGRGDGLGDPGTALQHGVNGAVVDCVSSLPVNGGMPASIYETGQGQQPPLPLHGLTDLQDSLQLTFADLEPSNLQNQWNDLLHPYNKLPADLVMNGQHGKQLWRFILKKRPLQPQVYVLCGIPRVMNAVAYGICDILGFDKKKMVWRLSDDGSDNTEEEFNRHVWSVVKSSRGSVI